ncbi:THxN family PEP-CTERM protein [Anabaena sp. UHCC 0451]|uniref:THxN family PEP-CTERM protein n=1 Tax=Anabaena sp. UHCC 0451 TaxID=2055235 RepID=UPI002B1F27AB|nr:THxN family PEP-CTERM protein [Anabaena sp. UHCC 0451]MEA5575333.1 THxN family PEP-CTERM protein [Anabaena sp. UHCC 0451]
MMIGHLLKNISLVATATATIGIFANSASALTLNSSSGTWSNTVGGSGVVTQTVGSENQVRWGSPLTNDGKSGLGFTGVGTTTFNPGDTFLLGTLRHFNNVISGGTAASQTKLNVNLNFSSPLTTQAFGFDLAIDETPNVAPASSCPYTSTIPCSDKISFPNAFPGNTFNIAGTDYTLQLLGFSDTLGGNLVQDFISQEGGTNSAYLYGKLTSVTPTSVPEPSSAVAVLALGALGAGQVIKRKKVIV